MKIRYPALLALVCAPLAHANLFINEIHYDNAGGDTGEAIEIAGPAGSDLNGWSVYLYNGSNGTVYGTTALSGVISDQQNGFGTISISYPSNGLQNGSPDAIALVDDSNNVIQLLSYEGTLTAVGGPADGMLSIDIGVSENGGTAIGESLQLSGTGSMYSDFSWNSATANTFGNVNTGQSFEGGDGGEDGGDGSLEGVCVNCPDLQKIKDASEFNDSDYYATVNAEVNNGSSASVIKNALTDVITTDHKNLTYQEVWSALTETDQDPFNSDNVIMLYKGTSIAKLSNGSGAQSQNPDNWNREHVWPNSHGFDNDGFEGFTDIHHLRPSDISINSERGNLDFDNSDSPLSEAPENRIDADSFEPRNEVKGDVARMMFYMDTRYEGFGSDVTPDLLLVDDITGPGVPELGRLCRLIEWHTNDPVNDAERLRNDTVYEYQGNRNPFIDHPEWVDILYTAQSCGDAGGEGGEDGEDGGTGTVTSSSLIITEIMQNPSAVSDSNGEWFEVLNTGTQIINLNGWTIRDLDNDSFTVDQDVFIGIGEYAVIGNNSDVNTNGGVTQVYSYGSQMFLSNGSDELLIEDTEGNLIDEITWDNGATFPDPNGASMTLVDLFGDNNVGEKWAEETTNVYGDGDNGTPGFGDAFGQLVITEIMQNPSSVSDSNGEYFEVLNIGVIAVNLNGWTISDEDNDSHTVNEDAYVPAGTYAVLARNADQAVNGGLVALYQYSGFTLANGGDEVLLNRPDGTLEDIVQYDGGPLFPDPNGASMTLTSASADNNVGSNWFAEGQQTYGDGDNGTPGSGPDGKTFGSTGGDDGGEDVAFGQCSDPATLISTVQGSGSASLLVNEEHVVEAVVTAVYPDFNGFFIQEETADNDADLSTSEGLFVDFAAAGDLPAAGDVVRLIGTVEENFDRTQIKVINDFLVCGTDSVEEVSFSLPFDSAEQAESLEGMLVVNQNVLTVTDNFNLGRFGSATLASERLFIPTNLHAPLSAEAVALAQQNALNRVIMDDGLSSQNPDPVVYPTGGLSANNTLRSGDQVTFIMGPLDYSFGDYRISPVVAPTIIQTNQREAQPSLNQGNLTVASLNVLNLFNGDGMGGGFPTSRGADTVEEFERQITKTVAAIAAMDADIVGLMEIENDGFDPQSMIAQLTDRLNDVAGAGVYAFVSHTGPIGTDAIAVGFLYKPASVSLVGDVQLNFADIFNRPPMAQTFEANNGAQMTIAVNHFKSKGCGGASGANADQNDGQGCYNARRVEQAQTLSNWLASESFGEQPNVLIIGDLNAYAKEDPIAALESTGYVNLVETYQGAKGYSYTFGGEFGYLDHALASPALLEQTVDTIEWHINSDEPRILDYNVEFKTAAQVNDYYAPDVFRTSDHDPVMISFDLAAASVRGDLDGDGDVDYHDMRALLVLIRSGQANLEEHDYNNDGVLNSRDVSTIRSLCSRRACAVR